MTIGPQSGMHLLGVKSQNRTAALPLMQEYGLDGVLVQCFVSSIAGRRAIS
jgi:hypothetical protein